MSTTVGIAKTFTIGEDDLKYLRAISMQLRLQAARATQQGKAAVMSPETMREIGQRLKDISHAP